ncbi:MAG TPA: hypothetical protein VGW74_01035 [Propionibacteriaceae bacterium]|nr:hypothetical protein [Propionibacteriaceae bacterium]
MTRRRQLGRSIEVVGWDGMMDALDRLTRLPFGQMGKWEQATERFYDHTQRFVHVDTVALKRSGRFEVSRVAHRAIGEVIYGGRFGVDYALFEMGRGGSHDALQLGMNVSAATYQATVGDMVMAALEEG